MLNIKLIACDIDGTLLDDNKNISSNMLNTINLLKEKNIIFVLITGRNDIYVKGLAKKIGISILNEERYKLLQENGEYDLKTSSWIVGRAHV